MIHLEQCCPFAWFCFFNVDDFVLLPLIVVQKLHLCRTLPFGRREGWESGLDYWKAKLTITRMSLQSLFSFSSE